MGRKRCGKDMEGRKRDGGKQVRCSVRVVSAGACIELRFLEDVAELWGETS